MSDRSTRASPVLPTLVLAFLLGATILAIQPAGGFPTSTSQEQAIDGRFGDAGALQAPPYVPYQVRYETNRFYLDGDASRPLDAVLEDCGSPPVFCDASPTNARLTMDRPVVTLESPPEVGHQAESTANDDPNDKQAYLVAPGAYCDPGLIGCVTETAVTIARFPLPEVLDDVQVVLAGATLYAACTSTTDPLGVATAAFDVMLFEQEKDETGNWVTVGNGAAFADFFATPTGSGGGAGTLEQYSGTQTLGNPILGGQGGNQAGVYIEKGHRIMAHVENGWTGGTGALPELTCVLHLGTADFDSHVLTIDNGARLAAFFDDVDGRRITGLALGSAVQQEDRKFMVHAVQASPWPNAENQLLAKEVNLRIYDLARQEYLYYVEDFNNAPPRERDFCATCTKPTTPSGQETLDLASRNDLVVSQSVVTRDFLFSYPPDLKDAQLQPELYSLEVNGAQWEATFPAITVGGRGVTLELPGGETATHQINRREPTEFLYMVRNVGSESDLVTVTASDPGAGWRARVLGGGSHFLPPGSVAFGTVELVPPDSAAIGDSRSVTVRASSQFPDVEDPATLQFRGEIVSAVRRAVEVIAAAPDMQVRPGETKGYQVLVANRGTSRDSFVVVPSIPANIQGWTVVSKPTSLQVPAGGLAPIQIEVTAPPEAPTDQGFPLGITVQEVGNAAISDRVDVTVNVFAAEGLLLDVFDAQTNRTMRSDASDSCADPTVSAPGTCDTQVGGLALVDTDFDNEGLFRVPVTNLGDRVESYRVEAFWDKSVPTADSSLCNNLYPLGFISASDGVPDGWMFSYAGGVGSIPAIGSEAGPADANPPRGDRSYGGFSGYYSLNTTDNPLVVPGHTTQDIYFELGWLKDDPCPANGNPLDDDEPTDVSEGRSRVAALRVRVTAIDDPVQTSQVTLIAKHVDAGLISGRNAYAGGTHDPFVALADPDASPVVVASEEGPSVFELVIVNRGNEHDDLKVQVAGSSEWTHRLAALGSTPAGKQCELPTEGGTAILCRGLGVFDEVRLQVIAAPGPLVRVGERDPITVTVTSGDAPGLARSLGLVARRAGTFDFATGPLGATTRTVQQGQALSFPFFIANEGTAADTYRVSVIRGDVGTWDAVLSSSAPLFVPAGHEVSAFMTVDAPAAAASGTTDVFRIQVESVGSLTRKTMEFSPIVQPASQLQVAGKDGQDILIPRRGVETTVNVTAVLLSGTATSMTFTADSTSLPLGWTLDRTTATVPAPQDSGGQPTATVTFKVKAPADALGTSRAILHVDALAGTVRGGTDLTLNLASTFGINLTAQDNATAVIAPAGSAIYNLTVANLGLGEDTVQLTHTTLPAGWTLLLNPPRATLGPLETIDVEAKLSAPATANPADIASVVVFATSESNPTQIDSVVLKAQVGFNALRIERVGTDLLKGAPQETLAWVLNVTNTGTLPDEVRLAGLVETAGVRPLVNYTIEPSRITLDPNQTVQVRAAITLGEAVPSDVAIVSSLTGTSLLDERDEPAKATVTLDGRVLPYSALDVNADGRRDFAVDRDGDAGNGFEQFRGNTRPGGRLLAAANLTRFLTEEALASFARDVTLADGSTVRVTTVTVDGDGDGKADHLLDADLDDQPDYYWDPDANKASRIEFRKDVNGDQVPESFVDASGDGSIDAVYDLTRGTFTKVIQLDVDGDGQLDYIVDKDGDGQVDADETVLYTRTGSLLIVQKVDVDGDGRLDQVFDTDGDGNPDYFVPAGSTASVPIVLRDVNGDGTMDWTFDGDDDGRRESYYDPVTGEAHVIDATGHFMEALKKYWYIGALFGLVLVLFVALVAVTRR